MDFVKQIETLFRSGTAAGLTDAQSLERCIERRDDAEAAFAALLDRHALAEEVVCAIGTAKMAVAAALILVTTALVFGRGRLDGSWPQGRCVCHHDRGCVAQPEAGATRGRRQSPRRYKDGGENRSRNRQRRTRPTRVQSLDRRPPPQEAVRSMAVH